MTTFAYMQVCGHIGDVQLRKSKGPSGRPYLRLTVAVDEDDGEKRTTWYVCIVNSRAVETPDRLLKTLTVGRKVYIRGSPRHRVYQKGDGSWVPSTTILVDGLPLLMDPKPKDHE